MQIEIYYVFTPTAALVDFARAAGVEAEIQVSVCTDFESDRIGRWHDRELIEHSFWNIFVAQLYYDEPEPEHLVAFRDKCLELGFSGCWTVTDASPLGNAKEIIAESTSEAIPFLNKRRERSNRSA
jgi:hypothetical protein